MGWIIIEVALPAEGGQSRMAGGHRLLNGYVNDGVIILRLSVMIFGVTCHTTSEQEKVPNFMNPVFPCSTHTWVADSLPCLYRVIR